MRFGVMAAVGVAVLACGTAQAHVRTLQEALSAAYSTNPTLQAARAQLRATDEGVPQALAGWRPTVVLSTAAGYADGSIRSKAAGFINNSRNERDVFTAQAALTQPLFRGGATRASTNLAENRVF